MHLEVEMKFRAPDLAAVERQLTALGAAWEAPLRHVDAYFRHPCRDFKQTDEALRIRRIGENNFVTYKGPKLDPLTKTRHELELPLPAGEQGFEQFRELLTRLGFEPSLVVRKCRRSGHVAWQGREVEAALDEVEGLGTFVELEILADESNLTAARQCVQGLAQHLGLTNSERRGYLSMLLEQADAE
jgi:adenylate cyclase class 2